MLKLYRLPKLLALLVGLFVVSGLVFASVSPNLPLDEKEHFYLDKTQLVSQQIDLLKKRLTQANQELSYLEEQHQKGFVSLPDDQANKFLLYKTGLQIASTHSSLDSIAIELSDSQQALSWLEKNIQEIENQLNASNIFGLKLIQEDALQVQGLRTELKYQENLYLLEKSRADSLQQLQKTENKTLQLYQERYAEANVFLKSLKMLHMKERQVKSELEFQQQQNYWLQQLDSLYAQMKAISAKDAKEQYLFLENEVFYANENINLVYLKTLIARYQDQIRQMRLSISKTSSISLLNTLSDQAQALAKQITRVDGLVNNRVDLIKKRRQIFINEKQTKAQNPVTTQALLQTNPTFTKFLALETTFQHLHSDVDHLGKRLQDFRGVLDKSIQHELSARQGLPGFSRAAWLELGRDLVLVPTLSFKLIKGFVISFAASLKNFPLVQGLLLFFSELALVLAFSYTRKILLRLQKTGSTKLFMSVCTQNLRLFTLFVGLWLLFHFMELPSQQADWLIYLTGVFFIFRAISLLARVALVESLKDNQGYDVKLYDGLRVIFIIGGAITGLTVFLHQLPLIYELKDLFDRLFLLTLLLASLLVLRFWRIVPQMIIDNIDTRQTYLRRIIYFMGLFVPALLFVNSLVGLFGFVNLVWMMAGYESIFTGVLAGYILVRGLLNDAMEATSKLMIRHMNNGWLWTEALLKPLQTILNLFLLFASGVLLFIFYGWDQQSPVVERLNKLLLYPVAKVMETNITPITVMELVFAIALFYWAARWARELIFRLLQSKIRDHGIRNSVAILSQYAVVVIGLLICLQLMGIDLHAFFLLGSGLLIALSFGLKDLVNNFACGLLLLVERPLRVGDIVSVNGHEGRVMHIGGRAVSIRTWDHMEVIVPNTELFNKSFLNWTVKDDVVRSVIDIKIDRKDNPFTVQEVIRQVLKQHKDVLAEPLPEVLMKEMIDSTSEFEVRYFINVKQVSSRVAVRSDVLFALWQAFSQHGIKAPNLQHEVMLKNQLPMLPEPS